VSARPAEVGWSTVVLVGVIGVVALSAPCVVVRAVRAPTVEQCAEKLLDGWQETTCEPGQAVEAVQVGDVQRLVCRCPNPEGAVKP
jgi:hypothetical protein